jgi:hypothetical protein
MDASQNFARRGDQRRFGTLFIGAGKVGSYHRVSLGAAGVSRAAFLRFKSIRLKYFYSRPQVFPIEAAASSAKFRTSPRQYRSPAKDGRIGHPRQETTRAPADEERCQEATGSYPPFAGHQNS